MMTTGWKVKNSSKLKKNRRGENWSINWLMNGAKHFLDRIHEFANGAPHLSNISTTLWKNGNDRKNCDVTKQNNFNFIF